MKYHKKDRHFLLHTLEHLLGVSVVLAVAFMLGYVGKVVASPESLLAEVASSVGATTTTSGTVSFRAELMGASCFEGRTKAKYSFLINPIDAGYVVLNTPNGTDYVDITNGRGMERFLQPGAYSWSGTPRSGFTGTGSGNFYVTELCSTTTPPPPPSTTTPPPPPPSTSTTQIEVTFSAQPGPIASCMETGTPLTPVFLLVTNISGGHFVISSNTGMSNAHLEWGEYPLPNGKYTWRAFLNPGYVGAGMFSGEFVLNNSCAGANTTSLPSPPLPVMPTITSSTTPPPPPPGVTTTLPLQPSQPPVNTLQILPRPILSHFVNNHAIPQIPVPVFDGEPIEFRVKTALSASASLFVIDSFGGTKPLGKAVRDDLLSRPGIDLWTLDWDPTDFPEGTYKLGARVIHEDGRNTLSERTTIKISHADATELKVNPEPTSTVSTSVRVTQEEKMAILERIVDPRACVNAAECRIYCESYAAHKERCITFVRIVHEQRTAELEESLADGVSDERLAQLLLSSTRRPKDIPDEITEPYEMKRFCASPDNAELCTNILVRNDMGAPDDLLAKRGVIERAREEERKVFTERIGARAHIDTDDDGVADYDELNIYHTDPTNADSDDDGFHDGAELLARTNPMGGMSTMTFDPNSSTTKHVSDESMLMEDPKIAGVEEDELLEVSGVTVLETGIGASGTTTATKLRLAGRAAPNSFVTIYIFSEPIVVTVKADSSGAWVYTLDKELPDGSHEIYSAITNAGGRILAKSQPLAFVKEAAAVSLISDTAPTGSTAPGFFAGTSLYALIAILIGIIGAALSIIGFMVRERKNEGQGPGTPTPA